MSTKKYKVAIFIGRFQPFHNAHLKIVLLALQVAERVIISIGSSHRPRTLTNPWTAPEREEQIRQVLASEGIDINRVKFISNRDYMYNNTKWAGEIYSHALMAGATDDKDTVLIGHYKDAGSFYLDMFPMWERHLVDNFYGANAIDIRYNLFEDVNYKSNIVSNKMQNILGDWVHTDNYANLREAYEFNKKYQEPFKDLPFKPIFVTVDNVVIKSGCILLIKRKFNPGKGLWALPGGFVNADEKIVKSAIRELKEETKIAVDKPVLERNIVQVKVFDHPYRSLRGRTITHAHLIDLGIGELPRVKASDDAAGAYWIPLADAYRMEEEFFEDHVDIIFSLTSRF